MSLSAVLTATRFVFAAGQTPPVLRLSASPPSPCSSISASRWSWRRGSADLKSTQTVGHALLHHLGVLTFAAAIAAGIYWSIVAATPWTRFAGFRRYWDCAVRRH